MPRTQATLSGILAIAQAPRGHISRIWGGRIFWKRRQGAILAQKGIFLQVGSHLARRGHVPEVREITGSVVAFASRRHHEGIPLSAKPLYTCTVANIIQFLVL